MTTPNPAQLERGKQKMRVTIIEGSPKEIAEMTIQPVPFNKQDDPQKTISVSGTASTKADRDRLAKTLQKILEGQLNCGNPHHTSNQVLSIGKTIRQARKKHNMSQSQLATALGVGSNTVWFWESDRNVPSTANQRKLETLFNVSLQKKGGNSNAEKESGKRQHS